MSAYYKIIINTDKKDVYHMYIHKYYILSPKKKKKQIPGRFFWISRFNFLQVGKNTKIERKKKCILAHRQFISVISTWDDSFDYAVWVSCGFHMSMASDDTC